MEIKVVNKRSEEGEAGKLFWVIFAVKGSPTPVPWACDQNDFEDYEVGKVYPVNPIGHQDLKEEAASLRDENADLKQQLSKLAPPVITPPAGFLPQHTPEES